MMSQGKSGAFFLISPDQSLIFKTIPVQEYKFMVKICNNYCQFMLENDSYIQKTLGLYKIKKSNERMYFIIMENVFIN